MIMPFQLLCVVNRSVRRHITIVRITMAHYDSRLLNVVIPFEFIMMINGGWMISRVDLNFIVSRTSTRFIDWKYIQFK